MSANDGRRGQRGRRRARTTALVLLGAAGTCLILVAVAVTRGPEANADPLANAPTITVDDGAGAAADGGGNGVAITWLGDTLLGDAAEPRIASDGMAWPTARLDPLPAHSVVIADLEGPFTDRLEPWDPSRTWSYHARPEAAEVLAALGVDAVSLASNHTMDRGPDGLADTLTLAEASGLAAFGAGPSSTEAALPLLIQGPETSIAVLAFDDGGGSRAATSDRPGVRRLTAADLTAAIDQARAGGADRVVAFVDWGTQYAPVGGDQRHWAQAFATAGYDLVVGTGPHVVQPIETVDGMPVAYSLGNWVFGTPGRFSAEHPGFGLVLTTTFGADALRLDAACIVTDNDEVAYQPRPCTAGEAASVAATIHPDLVATPEGGWLELPLAPSAP